LRGLPLIALTPRPSTTTSATSASTAPTRSPGTRYRHSTSCAPAPTATPRIVSFTRTSVASRPSTRTLHPGAQPSLSTTKPGRGSEACRTTREGEASSTITRPAGPLAAPADPATPPPAPLRTLASALPTSPRTTTTSRRGSNPLSANTARAASSRTTGPANARGAARSLRHTRASLPSCTTCNARSDASCSSGRCTPGSAITHLAPSTLATCSTVGLNEFIENDIQSNCPGSATLHDRNNRNDGCGGSYPRMSCNPYVIVQSLINAAFIPNIRPSALCLLI